MKAAFSAPSDSTIHHRYEGPPLMTRTDHAHAVRRQACSPLHPPQRHPLAMATLAVLLGVGGTWTHLDASAQTPAPSSTPQAAVRTWNLPAAPLADTLARIAREGGRSISADPALLAGKQATAVQGDYSVEEAAQRALAGSGLTLGRTPSGTLTVVAASAASATPAAPAASEGSTGALAAVTVTAQAERGGPTEGTGSYTTRNTSTATGLNLSLRETPQSVTIVTRQRMDDQATNDITTVLEQAVGVNVSATSPVGSDGVNFYARGFEIKNFQIDGLPRPSAIYGFSETTSDMAVYDRVEIVRGANGLLSGAGSPAAAINLVRKKPTADTQASVALELGSLNHNRLEANVGGALTASGNVRGRLVAVAQDSDSYMARANVKKQVVYGIAEVDLAKETRLTLGLEHQGFTNKGASRGGVPLFYTDGSKTHLARSTNTGAATNELKHPTTRFFSSLEHLFDNGWSVKLEAEESRPDYDEAFSYMWGAFDATTGAGSSVGTARWAGDLKQRIVNVSASGPFQLLGRQHELMAGASYSTAAVVGEDMPGWWSGGDYWAALPNAWPYLATGQYAQPSLASTGCCWGERIEQTSAYAAARLRPSDAVSVILGSRVSSWKETAWNDRSGSKISTTVKDESGVITPYAGLVVDLNDNLSAYASYTSIFEVQSAEDTAGQRLDPLTGNNHEIGLKGSFNGGKLNATLALFRIQQDNFAVAIPDAPLNPNGVAPSRAEDGTVSKGIELEVAGEFLPGWQLGGGYAYAKPKDAAGAQLLTHVPKDTLKVFSTYRFPGEWQGLTVGGSLRWQGKSFQTGSGPNGEDFVQNALVTVDLMARYAMTKNVTVALNINNLFDKTYYSGFSWNHGIYAAPRNLRATLKYQF